MNYDHSPVVEVEVDGQRELRPLDHIECDRSGQPARCVPKTSGNERVFYTADGRALIAPGPEKW